MDESGDALKLTATYSCSPMPSQALMKRGPLRKSSLSALFPLVLHG